MAAIKDIRLFKSDIENVDGNSLPSCFADKKTLVVIRRIVMKLREKDFSLGDFDHLYINFTTCSVENGIAPSKRSKDRYYPWYRYYDVEVSRELFDMLEVPQSTEKIVDLTEKVLLRCFAAAESDREDIRFCFAQAIEQGENMLTVFKEKKTAKNKAVIYARYLDNCRYFPLLRVFDTNNELIFEKDLPETQDFGAYGEIQLGSKKVTIKPRKSIYAQELEPMSFEL